MTGDNGVDGGEGGLSAWSCPRFVDPEEKRKETGTDAAVDI